MKTTIWHMATFFFRTVEENIVEQNIHQLRTESTNNYHITHSILFTLIFDFSSSWHIICQHIMRCVGSTLLQRLIFSM